MKTSKYQLVELVCAPNTVNRGIFTDQPQLRTKTLQAIETFSAEAVPVSPAGNPVIANADFKKSFLVLNEAGTDKEVYIPLCQLNRISPDQTTNVVAGVQHLAEFEGLQVDWSKSYVQFSAAPATTQFSILFGVHYRD